MNTAVAAHSLTSIKLNLPAERRAYYGGKWHVDEINPGTGESLGPVGDCGPENIVALINPVSSIDDAIEHANALPYGLAAYAFTRSARNADRLADELEAGNLSINHRQLLRFLASSPLFAAGSAGTMARLFSWGSQEALAQSYDVLRGSRRALGPDGIITAPADALDVLEFEPAAEKAMFSEDLR
jgi:hypothetical protein